MYKIFFAGFLFLASMLIISCSSEPEPINYGHDECEFCRMQITDSKYGAEIVTGKGKIYKFDSVECLVEFALVKNLIGDKSNSLLVTDFSIPETFIDATNALYLKNDNFRSPMGLNVMAFGIEDSLHNFKKENGGRNISWVEVIELVQQRSM